MLNFRIAASLSLPILVFAAFQCASAQPAVIANKDVYLIAEQLADEVELIREVMGRPYDDSPRLPVSNVSIAEVFFQARTLLRKSNQLARELAGTDGITARDAPVGEIRAADVYDLVAAALEQVRLVRAELGISEPVVPQQRDTDIAPTGLFSTIIDSNRQLNLLLSTTITSADVYEQVSLAVDYSAAMLATRAPDLRIAPAPFEVAKRPVDVYERLLESVDIASRLAAKHGVSVVSLSTRRNVPDDVEPGHVYDLANIVVADLAILAKALEARPARAEPGPTPKHVFPSHVYQRAGTLKLQLEALETAL
jgi:hypothetical protein